MKTLRVCEIVPGKVYQRGQFYTFSPEEKQHELQRLGITAVVCLLPKEDPDLTTWLGNLYFHFPLPDGLKFPERTVLDLAITLGDHLEQGKNKVLIHCRAGRNRSSLLSTLLSMRLFAISGAAAVRRTRMVRPNALANVAFEQFLDTLHYSKEKGYYKQ